MMATTTPSPKKKGVGFGRGDPYSEIESYLRKAEEEISAVFSDKGTKAKSENQNTAGVQEDLSRPRTPARPPLLDGQASPSKIRKVYTKCKTEPSPPLPRRQASVPSSHPRRRVPFIRKPRRVSAPSLIPPQNGDSTPPPWQPRQDPHLQEWSQGLLKDFHSLVEEEIRLLRGRSSASHTPKASPKCQAVFKDVPSSPFQLVRHTTPVSQAVVPIMGATQSTGRGDPWGGERHGGTLKTYTLPRAGGHRSVSISGAGAISYRASSAHPDDTEVSCELLRVNPRFSRSHSLDEGAGLSPWALHHLSVIDDIHVTAPTPAEPSSSNSNSTSQATLQSAPSLHSEPTTVAERHQESSPKPEGHYGKIRKSGFTQKQNEQWQASLSKEEQCHTSVGSKIANGWSENGTFHQGFSAKLQKEGSFRTNYSGYVKSRSLSCVSSNGSSAFTPADLKAGKSETWAWADQEDACTLTDRPCDTESCDHCLAKAPSSLKTDPSPDSITSKEDSSVNKDLASLKENVDCKEESILSSVTEQSVPDVNTPECVSPYDTLTEKNDEVMVCVTPPESEMAESLLEPVRVGPGRKSEPALLSIISSPLDARRHTLPAPRTLGSLSLLSAPLPTFDTSSWETLPPADELEVELEEKPIFGNVVRPSSPVSISASSSRSLNSSLSSLSHLSVHPDHSDCDSWPSSPVANQHDLSPDIFFNPVTMTDDHESSGDVMAGRDQVYSGNSETVPSSSIEVQATTLSTTQSNNNSETHNDSQTMAIHHLSPSCTPSPEPITGMLHLTPVGPKKGCSMIFSVSIPEDKVTTKRKHSLSSISEISDNSVRPNVANLRIDNNEEDSKRQTSDDHEDTTTQSTERRPVTREVCCGSSDHSQPETARKFSMDQIDLIKQKNAKFTQRNRSVSFSDAYTSARNQNITQVNSSTQSQQPEALNDFLRAVESRIRRESLDPMPEHPSPNTPCSTLSTPASTPVSVGPREMSFSPTVVLDAFTQTTPAPTPPPTPPLASRASSDTWLSECGCDDLVSMEPCTSSLALSATEDDYGDDGDDDDDDDEEDWSAGVSLSSSSPPATPASMPRDDSSLSLSESLDTLDLNGESGIGTVSTRPSISPPSYAHATLDLSGSNLSSEDTGLENSFERQIRRYIPHSRSGRESDHVAYYRRRRPRPRHHEQWVRCEDQMTQTDPQPHALALNLDEDVSEHSRESNETLEQSRRGSEERVVRHTHSEPRLDAPLTPMGGALRGVCSEAALPPIPLPQTNRTHLTPSAPTLPTLTEDKPPIAPTTKPPRPRHLSLVSPNLHHHHHIPQPSQPGKACSAPTLETRPHVHTPATTPSEESSGETPALTTRAQSAKEIAELEAIEACKWLRAAGFPQYAQMYEELQFPLDLGCVERDHNFLDADSLQALFRRLRALNRCAKIRLDSARKNKGEESDDEEQQCALSGNWKFQRHSRRWSRIVHDTSLSPGGEVRDSGESGGGGGGLEVPEDALLGHFKRSGSERLRDGAKALLRRMESLKNKKKKRQTRDGVVISGPKLVDEAHMQMRVEELACVDISANASPELTARSGTTTPTTVSTTSTSTTTTTTTTTTSLPRDIRQTTPGEDSSSLASDHSQTSTPLFRGRRRRRFWRRGGSGHGGGESGGGGGGGGGAYSDSECSPPTWRHYLTDANSNKMTPHGQTPSSSPEKRSSSKPGNVRSSRPGQLRHTGSLTYGKESQVARENFLASIRGGGEKNDENLSPMPSPEEERHSVYDNVPLIICNKSYHDYQPEVMDSEASAHEGSGSSECTVESRDSPLPSTHDEEENEEPCQRRATVDRWHSFNRKSYQATTRQLGTQINGFSSGQMLHLRKRALLRLTALMERYCPTNRTGWNWELPKFIRKMKSPDYRDRQVFGVPLLVIAQRTGQPLPSGILLALQYLRTSSLDQVGIFRKPGVRSRIQKIREFHEVGEEIQYSKFGTCDIADMVKTYFRELPEVLLTNKLSEMFIAIFQYLPVEHRLEALQCAVLMLPDENREVLMALLTFLADVAASSHLNQMHASNLAVCLAPSLFHLNVGGSGSSPLRRRAPGTPEQKDLHENKAAHHCLTLMIQQVSQLQCVPTEMLANCRFTYLEQSQPVCLEDLGVVGSPGTSTVEGDWASYMNACITSLLKEARDKSRGWVHMNAMDTSVEVLYRKVGDGHPLRLWRATTEVEAPPAELLNRVIRERHLWDESLLKWRVVSRLDRQAEVFQYMCNSMPPRPPVDYCVLRCWRSDMARGTCVIVETSVEHADAPILVGGVRGIVLASRYLIQPCGSGKSRITHISRLDMRGRTPEWYNKIYGHVTAMHLTRIRQSFHHNAVGPESKV